MKTIVASLLLLLLTACSASHSISDYKEMRTQVEYVNDAIVGNFTLSESLRWNEVMEYLRVNEPETYEMFKEYETEIFAKQDQYLLLLRDRCDKHIIMYDYSCTERKLDGPLYDRTDSGSIYDIVPPECANAICFIR